MPGISVITITAGPVPATKTSLVSPRKRELAALEVVERVALPFGFGAGMETLRDPVMGCSGTESTPDRARRPRRRWLARSGTSLVYCAAHAARRSTAHELPAARRLQLPPLRLPDGSTEPGIGLSVHEAGAGPAVVLCHGFPELGYSWRHQIPALAAAGFRAIAPDQRGYGASDRPSRSTRTTSTT